MQRDQTARAEEIAETIRDLFAPEDDYVLVVGDNSIFGSDGIVGLRLLVNHLFDEVYRDEPSVERCLVGSQERPTEEASARRRQLQQGLRELAKRADVEYALCYHIRGAASWDAA